MMVALEINSLEQLICLVRCLEWQMFLNKYTFLVLNILPKCALNVKHIRPDLVVPLMFQSVTVKAQMLFLQKL